MDKAITREVVVTVVTQDRPDPYTYTTREIGRATRTFPVDTDPMAVASWAGRTTEAQIRDSERTYPLPKDEEAEQKASEDVPW